MSRIRVALLGAALAIACCASASIAGSGPSPLDDAWAGGFALPSYYGTIYAFADYGGQVIAGGSFTEAGLTHARYVAAWDGSDWHALGDGVGSTVHALLPYAGGLAAGSLLAPGAATSDNIRLWDGTNWSVLGATDGDVYALALFGGDLVAGGSFTQVNGVPAAGVALWDGTSWKALGSVGAAVRALAVHNGQLVAAGSLASVNNVAVWNGTNWSQLGAGLQYDFGPTIVRGIVSDGVSLYAMGQFTKSGTVACAGGARWDGTAWNATPGSDANGSAEGIGLWQGAPVAIYLSLGSFVPKRWTGSAWVSMGDSVRISAMAVHQSGTRLYLGASSGSLGGKSASGFFEFDGTTWRALQRAWAPGMSGISGGPNDVLAWGGKLIYAGSFSQVGAEDHFTPMRNIAAWDGSAWSSLGSPNALNSFVSALVPWQGSLIVGGFFSSAGGVLTHFIARWNGTNWSALGTPQLDLWVVTLGTYGPDLIASGYFTYGGSAVLNGIGRWDGTSWHPLGDGMGDGDGWAYALAEWNGVLAIGADFTEIGGTPASRLAAWNGTSYSELGGGVNGDVYALTVFEGDLIAGGEFTAAGGTPVNAVARWNGTTWTPLGSNALEITRLKVIDGRLFATGEFLCPDLTTNHGLAVWNGTTWFPLGSGTDGDAVALAEYGGDVYVVGYFGWAYGRPSFTIARFTGLSQLAVEPAVTAPRLALATPWPNPSGRTVRLGYVLPEAGLARLTVLDIAGRRVATLEDGVRPAGQHVASWDGRDARGGLVAPGLYFARLETRNASRVVKLVRER